MKTLFSILTTSKYRETRQRQLKETWLAGRDYFFASDVDDGDQIKLSDRQDHASAEEKQLFSFGYIVKNYPSYDRYFFCDDDTFVNVKLYDLIDEAMPENSGHVLSQITDPRNPLWAKRPDFSYFSGGAGFILSQNAVKAIAEYVPFYNERTKYGDISVGIIMDKLGIPKRHNVIFNKDTPESYGHRKNDIRLKLTYHYVKDHNVLWSEL